MTSLPLFIFGIGLLFFPARSLSIISPLSFNEDSLKTIPVLPFFIKLVSIGLLYFATSILTVKNQPSENRDIIFWQGIFFLAFGGLCAIGPFFFQLSYWVLVLAVTSFASSVLYLGYSSRNILVKE